MGCFTARARSIAVKHNKRINPLFLFASLRLRSLPAFSARSALALEMCIRDRGEVCRGTLKLLPVTGFSLQNEIFAAWNEPKHFTEPLQTFLDCIRDGPPPEERCV